MIQNKTDISQMVSKAISNTKITDIHTHLYAPSFGSLLLWGIDELLTFHYLISETFRWLDMPYEKFWTLTKREQADIVWKTLFVDHSPISESARGVLTMLNALGLDVSSRDLNIYRKALSSKPINEYIDQIFNIVNIESVVMTNDPFDNLERPVWLESKYSDKRFHAALRLDFLLNSWDKACPYMQKWGYKVNEELDKQSCEEVKRFLNEWIEKMDAIYVAASLPSSFRFPEDSSRGKLIEECVLPAVESKKLPFAMMIGVKRQVNPSLKLAGDSIGRSDIESLEYMCKNYPQIKFLITMLSKENQHEICVVARKFRNLMPFGCWWFLNMPSIIEEMTRMRVELLGVSFIPQHSDARVLEQVVYKWLHSKAIINEVLTEKYYDVAKTGWIISEKEIQRDVEGLFGGNFWKFIKY